jgi:hypothetical protein
MTTIANKPKRLDVIEAMNAELPQVDCPLTHRFVPGMYVREIFMEAGLLITSKLHKTEHPFIISKGEVLVFTETDGTVRLKAPHTGITKAGTRRLLYIIEDTVWTTFHLNPTNTEDLIEIEDRVIEKHDNPCMNWTKEKIEEEIKCLSEN